MFAPGVAVQIGGCPMNGSIEPVGGAKVRFGRWASSTARAARLGLIRRSRQQFQRGALLVASMATAAKHGTVHRKAARQSPVLSSWRA
jgi:hypothetical protein